MTDERIIKKGDVRFCFLLQKRYIVTAVQKSRLAYEVSKLYEDGSARRDTIVSSKDGVPVTIDTFLRSRQKDMMKTFEKIRAISKHADLFRENTDEEKTLKEGDIRFSGFLQKSYLVVENKGKLAALFDNGVVFEIVFGNDRLLGHNLALVSEFRDLITDTI